MGKLFDAGWRALAYCLHPRVVALSLLPVGMLFVLAWAFVQWGWQDAVQYTAQWLHGSWLDVQLASWAARWHWPGLAGWLPDLLVVLALLPMLVLASLLAVAVCMTPAVARLVRRRRFADLERRHGASEVTGIFWSLGHGLAAAATMLASLPLWWIPPLALVLPPLIWGWCTSRVMAFDVLADCASAHERRWLMHRHRYPLLVMGIVTALLGGLPAVVWISTAWFVAAFLVLIPLAIWIYAMVFAFASLWFSHYCLAALRELRTAEAAAVRVPAPAWSAPARVLEPDASAALSLESP